MKYIAICIVQNYIGKGEIKVSIVAAIKDDNKVWVACDSQVSFSGTKMTLSNPNNFKIFKPMNDHRLIVGVVGALRDANILSTLEDYIDEATLLKNNLDFKYVVKNVVPYIMRELDKHGRLVEHNERHVSDSQFLFVYDNNIYTIDGDGCVVEHDDFCAIGSGYKLAYGSFNTSEEMDNQEILVNAVKSACMTDLYVNYPIILMNTQDNETVIINK